MGRQAIVAAGFSYTYRGSTRKALEEVTFAVEEGECCAIVGPAEAGKSTLCYAIASVIPRFIKGGSAEGSILIHGRDLSLAPLEDLIRQVGVVHQNPFIQISGIKPTVREEVALALENLGVPRQEMLENVEATLAQLDIAHLAQRDPLTLSGGEMQKVALASTLVLDPAILILDEPTSQLDPGSIGELVKLLRQLKAKKTLLLVEHKMEILPALADKVVALAGGRVLLAGAAAAVFSSGECIEAKIGAPLWTLLAYRVANQQRQKLPWSYRDALRWFGHVPPHGVQPP